MKLKGNAQRRMTEVLRRYAPVANSFFAMRAAAAWRIREEIRGLLREREILRLPEQAEDRDGVLDRIKTALSKLNMVQNMQREELLESGGGKSKRAQSKRLDLHRLPKNWREQIIGCSNGMAYEEIFCVLAATGCRPEELSHGVTLNRVHDHVHVRIMGAKVGDSSVQIWREFKVSWIGCRTPCVNALKVISTTWSESPALGLCAAPWLVRRDGSRCRGCVPTISDMRLRKTCASLAGPRTRLVERLVTASAKLRPTTDDVVDPAKAVPLPSRRSTKGVSLPQNQCGPCLRSTRRRLQRRHRAVRIDEWFLDDGFPPSTRCTASQCDRQLHGNAIAPSRTFSRPIPGIWLALLTAAKQSLVGATLAAKPAPPAVA